MSEKDLIYNCGRQDRLAQHTLYKAYGSKVLGVCKRYMKNHERAEEAVMDTFITVFNKISQYKSEGSFEGWILKIAVNCCLMQLRKKTNFGIEDTIDNVEVPAANETVGLVENEDIEAMLKILPDGARIIFNLYAIEGYKHAEIAQQLGISEGTSKSQLHYAKERLKQTFFNTTRKTGSHDR